MASSLHLAVPAISPRNRFGWRSTVVISGALRPKHSTPRRFAAPAPCRWRPAGRADHAQGLPNGHVLAPRPALAQSMAFFSPPGSERLNSGATSVKSSASRSAMAFSRCRAPPPGDESASGPVHQAPGSGGH